MDCFGTYFTHAQTCNVTCAVSPSNVFHPDALDWLDSELQEEKSSWNTQKNLTKVHKSKKALKHRTVGSANVPVWAYIYNPIIHLLIYTIKINQPPFSPALMQMLEFDSKTFKVIRSHPFPCAWESSEPSGFARQLCSCVGAISTSGLGR